MGVEEGEEEEEEAEREKEIGTYFRIYTRL